MFHASYSWSGPQLPKGCGCIEFLSPMHKKIPMRKEKGAKGEYWSLVSTIGGSTLPQGHVPPYRLECTDGLQLIDAGHLQPLRSSEALCLPPPFTHKLSPYHCLYKTVPQSPCCGLECPIYGLSTSHMQEKCTGPIWGAVTFTKCSK